MNFYPIGFGLEPPPEIGFGRFLFWLDLEELEDLRLLPDDELLPEEELRPDEELLLEE